LLREGYRQAETLARKLQAMRSAIAPDRPWVREMEATYGVEEEGSDASL